MLIGLLVLFGGGSAHRPGSAPIIARAPAGIASEWVVLGNADAPVTIDIFEDFQCPACQAWGTGVLPALADAELRSGRAKLVFHDFAFLGPESTLAAHAGYAASRQGRFWDMWSTIYANQGPENRGRYTAESLKAMAAGLDLDLDRFAADLNSQAAITAQAAGNAAASAAGVDSTPTVMVAGRRLASPSYSAIAAAVAVAAASAP